jgi:hypothetical protein
VAELRDTFKSGLEVIFDTYEEAVHEGTYTLGSSNEFDANLVPETDRIRCIFGTFRAKDVSLLSFSELIQPNDIIGIIPHDDLSLDMNTEGYVEFDDEKGIYTVVGYERDPLKVTYTVLLRKN